MVNIYSCKKCSSLWYPIKMMATAQLVSPWVVLSMGLWLSFRIQSSLKKHQSKEASELISLHRPRTWKKMVCGKTFQNWKCEPQGRHRIPGGTEAPGNEIHPGDITKPWRWDVLTYAFVFAVPHPLPEAGVVANAKILGRRGHLFSLDQAVFWTYAWLQDCHNEYGTHEMLQAASPLPVQGWPWPCN